MSEGCVAAAASASGPWVATRLWNEIVLAFRSGMPRQRQRVNMKSVDGCFSGREAVEWLHGNLARNPSFAQEITKEQTAMLLQKFLQENIIVRADSSSSAYEKREAWRCDLQIFVDLTQEQVRLILQTFMPSQRH